MKVGDRRRVTRTLSSVLGLVSALACGLAAPGSAIAQGPGTKDGQWTYLGGDAWHTRYTPLEQIEPSNFEELEIAWEWKAASFGPSTSRATPTYVDGKLITVSGDRRHVVALDPATGEVHRRTGLQNSCISSPAIAEGKVFVGSWDDHIYALDKNPARTCGTFGQVIRFSRR